MEIKPNYRTLGPRFGKEMPLVAQAVAGLDPASAAATVAGGGTVGISVGGHDHQLGAEDLLVAMKPLPGYQVEREGAHAVALDLTIDDELRAEGWARDAVRAAQLARQEAGLDVSDRIALVLGGDPGSWRRREPTRTTSRARPWPWRCPTNRCPTPRPWPSTAASSGSA